MIPLAAGFNSLAFVLLCSILLNEHTQFLYPLTVDERVT